MRVQYLIIAIVFLGCSCQNITIIEAVLNDTEVLPTEPIPVKLFVDDLENSPPTETVVEKPDLSNEPPILIAKNPIDDNVDESESPLQPEVLPVIMTLGATNENSKCNTSECPKYKCGTYLIPANLTAGECCDHCAPATVKPVSSTKKPTSRPSSSSSSSEEGEGRSSSSSSSSSEQHDGQPLGCNIRHFNSKPHKSHPRLLHRLTEALIHFRRFHSHRRHDDSSESPEY